MLNRLKYNIRLKNFQKKYKKANPHNYTLPTALFDLNKVSIGNGTYGNLNVYMYNNPSEKLTIGSYCSIADNVTFLLAGEHNYKCITTYPFKKKILQMADESISKGPIVIEDDVWIGYGATILSGVTIGQGAIVGAWFVVTKDIPPYAIYANGKIMKYRFSEKIIEKLKTLDFSNLNLNSIRNNLDLLYETITEKNVEKIKELNK